MLSWPVYEVNTFTLLSSHHHYLYPVLFIDSDLKFVSINHLPTPFPPPIPPPSHHHSTFWFYLTLPMTLYCIWMRYYVCKGQYLSFCDWIISSNTVSLGASFLFRLHNIIHSPLYIGIALHLSIYSLIDTWATNFHFLVIMNNSAIHMGVQISRNQDPDISSL